MSTVYLRPVGPLSPPPAQASETDVLRIGPRQDLVFAGFELIQRQPGGTAHRRAIAPGELGLMLSQAGPTADRLKALMSGFASAPACIADLALDRPRIMGIVNVTPDSFADGGQYATPAQAIAHALSLEQEGADILDIGGESTRPGAVPVSVDEELRRVMPVIEGLRGRVRVPLSIDTRNSGVMRRAASAGVRILNDISALTHDPLSLETAVQTRLAVILMHARGDPRTMQQQPRYDDVLLDVYDYLESRIEACMHAGIARDRLIVDPGIGFGKTGAHNLQLLAGLSLFHGLGTPILLGASRKRFIGALTGAAKPSDRVPGSVAAALHGAAQGAQILRVHDVAATRQALTIWEAARAGSA